MDASVFCRGNLAQEFDLEQCRECIRVLADCNPALVWISGPDGLCTYFNRAWLAFTGRPLEQGLGNGWADDVHPDDLPSCLRTYLAAVEKRRPFSMMYRLRRADGVYRWVNDTASPFYDADGGFAGMIGSCLDVTDHRQALLEAEERFRLLVHSVEEYAIVTLDPERRVASWNEGAQRMTGYGAAEAVGRASPSFFTPDDQARGIPEQLFLAAVRQGHLEVEVRVVRKDGLTFLACISLTVLRDESGRLRGYGLVLRDITKRRAAEEALRDSEKRFRTLAQMVPVGIFSTDELGHYEYVNARWSEITGFDVEQAVDGGWIDAVHADDRDGVLARWRKAVGAHRPFDAEFRYRRPDGRVVWAHVQALPDSARSGAWRGYVGCVADITRRRKLEDGLRRTTTKLHLLSDHILAIQENERRHIARELHDEIGQALTAVKLKLEATRQASPACRAPLEDSVAMCETALERVKSLFLGLRPPQLDDLGLVAAVRWHLDRQGREAGFESHLRADEDLPRLDPNLETACFRVIQEALTNVVRHAGARHVWIELALRDAELVIEVRDDGRGFDVHLDRPEACIGLSGMEERVILAGGRFEVVSVPGKGTVVRAAIPLDARASR